MKKLVFVERKFWGFVSIEKIFEQISRSLAAEPLSIEFQKVNFDNNLTGILKNLLFFRRQPADIYHITGHIHYMALVLPADRTILTVHDLGFLHYRRGLRRYLLKKLFLDWPIRRLRYLTAISETTKNEILQYTKCASGKIVVIENPLQSQYLAHSAYKFNSNRPTILQIGTLPNKNVERLIEAISGLECKLRIVGHLDDSLRDLLVARRVVFENVFDLNDKEMREEYENADIVAFCSTYEGFGMPVIEAQSVGRPVITSDISPLRDVAGKGGAYLADPLCADDIRNGLEKIIYDESFRNAIIAAGFKNVKRYHPDRIAAAYKALYNKVLHEGLGGLE